MVRSAVVVGVLVVLTACGEEPAARPVQEPTAKDPVNSEAIARAIEARLENGVPLRVAVSCPRDIEWKAGTKFRCLVKDPDGTSRATVTLGKSGDGAGGPSSGSGRTAQGEYSWTLD